MHRDIEGSRCCVVLLVGFDDTLRLFFVQRSGVAQGGVGDRTDFLFHFRFSAGEFLPVFACLIDHTLSVLTVAVLLVQRELIRGFASGNFVILEPATGRFE